LARRQSSSWRRTPEARQSSRGDRPASARGPPEGRIHAFRRADFSPRGVDDAFPRKMRPKPRSAGRDRRSIGSQEPALRQPLASHSIGLRRDGSRPIAHALATGRPAPSRASRLHRPASARRTDATGARKPRRFISRGRRARRGRGFRRHPPVRQESRAGRRRYSLAFVGRLDVRGNDGVR